VGCRVQVQSSQNAVTRYLGVDSDPVNHSWMCDRGRFDFEAVGSDDRVTAPQVRKNGELVEVSWGEALAAAATSIKEVMAKHGASAVAVLGGGRLANEDAYAWAKLAKGVIGTDSVDAQLGDGLPPALVVGLPEATIDEALAASTLIVLAPDAKEALPVLFLRLRDAVLETGLNIVELAPEATSLSPLSAASISYRPGEAAASVTALFATEEPPTPALRRARAVLQRPGALDNVVVLLGRPSLAESGDSIAAAADALRAAVPEARFLLGLRRGNVRGALDLGLAPGMLPGRVSLDAGKEWFKKAWGKVPSKVGVDATGILSAAAEGRVHALVLLGADPMTDFPDRELARRGLSSASVVVAVDTFLTASSSLASVVLPAETYAERGGTTTNMEGRVTHLAQKVVGPGTTWADWMIAVELAAAMDADLKVESLNDLWDEIARVAPAHAGLTRPLLAAPARIDGIVVGRQDQDPAVGAATLAEVLARDPSAARPPATVVDGASSSVGLRIQGDYFTVTPVMVRTAATSVPDEAPTVSSPAQPAGPGAPATHTWTGTDYQAPPVDAYSFRLVSGRALYDQSVSVQKSPSLAGLARSVAVRVHPDELSRLGVTSGDRVRVTSTRTSLTMEARADPGVPRGSVAITFNLAGQGAADLIDATQPVTDVRLETT